MYHIRESHKFAEAMATGLIPLQLLIQDPVRYGRAVFQEQIGSRDEELEKIDETQVPHIYHLFQSEVHQLREVRDTVFGKEDG